MDPLIFEVGPAKPGPFYFLSKKSSCLFFSIIGEELKLLTSEFEQSLKLLCCILVGDCGVTSVHLWLHAQVDLVLGLVLDHLLGLDMDHLWLFRLSASWRLVLDHRFRNGLGRLWSLCHNCWSNCFVLVGLLDFVEQQGAAIFLALDLIHDFLGALSRLYLSRTRTLA